MSSLGNIIRKEVKELLTPSALIPIIIMALVFGSIGSMVGGSTQKLSEKPTIGVIDLDHSPLSQFVYTQYDHASKIIYNQSDVQAGIDAVRAGQGVALIVINPGFESNISSNHTGSARIVWVLEGASIIDSISVAPVSSINAIVLNNLSRYIIDHHITDNSSVVLQPVSVSEDTVFKGHMMAGVNPGTIQSVVQQQGIIVPVIVLMVIIMAGSMVVSSMGMEKENKTLETLLTLPVKRTSIVLGKLVGAAIVGLIVAVIYMFGFSYYMSSLTVSAPIDLAKYGMTLNMFDYLLVGVSLFLALVCGLALCMILGIFTKNYKAAQSMTLPVTLLAMVPMFITMFADFNTLPTAIQALVFGIPFSHPMMAMKELMFGNTAMVLAGIAYEAIFAAVAMFIAVTLFKKDILLTGRAKSAKKGKVSLLNYGLLKKR
ncbi:MAG TPA: ABC transporter permease [Methanomassiliicoccales archaeon]|nr:ABC transporter permease [Methanomassiliicoccales archaeon]